MREQGGCALKHTHLLNYYNKILMKKILYYKLDKRCKDNFRPIYMEAPWYLWGALEIAEAWLNTEILFYWSAKMLLKITDIIEQLNE